jgi:hypothetical protein
MKGLIEAPDCRGGFTLSLLALWNQNCVCYQNHAAQINIGTELRPSFQAFLKV